MLDTLHLTKEIRMFLAVAVTELADASKFPDFYYKRDYEELKMVEQGIQQVHEQFKEHNNAL
jgi:hypothetical protein